jgi:3-hydroxyisobutyrate dehydrogenase-like beta-hydroxyacid dehydrogenase
MSNLSQQKVAFIGLGVMGFPMAGHLQQKGEQVCVYIRKPQTGFSSMVVHAL